MLQNDTFFVVSTPTALLWAVLWLVVGLLLGYCWCAVRHYSRSSRVREDSQQK